MGTSSTGPTNSFNHVRQPGEPYVDFSKLRKVELGDSEIPRPIATFDKTFEVFDRIGKYPEKLHQQVKAGGGDPHENVAIFQQIYYNKELGIAFEQPAYSTKRGIAEVIKALNDPKTDWGSEAIRQSNLTQYTRAQEAFRTHDAANRPKAAKDFKP